MAWYTGDVFYDTALLAGFAYVLIIVLASKFGQAAYGRFGGWASGVKFEPRLGWVLMELPAPLVFLIVFFQGQNNDQLVPMIFLGIWIIHYSNRGFINPMLMRVHKGSKASFNISVVIFGWIATAAHGFFSADFIANHAKHLTPEWSTDPSFLVGIVIYVIGWRLHSPGYHGELGTTGIGDSSLVPEAI